MRRIFYLLSFIILLFFISACILGSLKDQLQDDVGNPEQPLTDFENWSQVSSYPIQIASGQENLDNFREHSGIDLAGTDQDGTPFTGYQEVLREIDRGTGRRHEVESLDTPSKYLSGDREWVEMDGYWYLVHEMERQGLVCEKNPISEDTSHYSEHYFTRLLTTITPGELLDKEQMNGVLTDVYQIEDPTMLFVREISAVSGKVWIAQDPNFILKAEGTIEGVLEFENRLYDGTAAFQFEISDFDQVQVQLPDICAHPPQDFLPIPGQARDINDFGGLITFDSPGTVEQVVNYYLAELQEGGWQLVEHTQDQFEQTLKASLVTPQEIYIEIEVKIIAMGDNNTLVQLSWVTGETQ